MPESSWRRKRAIRLSRSSSFTRRARRRSSEKVLQRNSPRVRGRGMRNPREKLHKLYAEARASGFGCGLPAKILTKLQRSLAQTLNTGVTAVHKVTLWTPQGSSCRSPKTAFSGHGHYRRPFRGRWQRGGDWELLFPDTK